MHRSVAGFVVTMMFLMTAGCGSDPRPDDENDDDASGFEWPAYVVNGGYADLSLAGWNVHLAQPLVEEQRDLGAAVVAHLQHDLDTVTAVLPASARATLQQVPIWVAIALPEIPGGAYHPAEGWLVEHGYPATWARSVTLGNAANYLDWTLVQPAMVLHELAHAWHDQQLGFADTDVKAAYDAAVASGNYANVLYAGGGTRPAYALENEREYFAEISEAWFWRNDFTPYVRSELNTFDPQGAALMQAKWPAP